MHVLAADRPEFAPPAAPGRLRALSLALLAHLLLLAALTWGVHWRNDSATPAVEAELWSAVPQQAAPKLIEAPEPEPTPAPAPPKADPGPSAAEIALAREKERKAREKLEQEQREKERLAQQKQEQDRKLAEDKKKKDLEAQQQKRKDQQEAQLREKLRQEQLQRMSGLAGASGAPSASGNALRSAGPSGSYAGRIVARVRPNIVFTEDIAGNPSAEVEVRCAPDGTIVGTRLSKSSGSKAWDEAVLKALTKTETLPRDTDGRVPSSLIISFRPRD